MCSSDLTRRGVMCAHREPAYAGVPWRVAPGQALRRSEEARDRMIILPLYYDLGAEAQRAVARALSLALTAAR